MLCPVCCFESVVLMCSKERMKENVAASAVCFYRRKGVATKECSCRMYYVFMGQ